MFLPKQSRHCEVKSKLQNNSQTWSTKGNWKMQLSKREKTFDTGTCDTDNNFDKLLQFCSKTILQNGIFLQKVFYCLKDMDNEKFSLEDHAIKYWLVLLIWGTEKKKDFWSNCCLKAICQSEFWFPPQEKLKLQANTLLFFTYKINVL